MPHQVSLQQILGVTDSVPITSATPAATVSVSQPKPVIAPVSKSRPVGAFTDGTYTGVVSDAFYGNIQVQAIIRNGALADVVFLQYPNDRNHSVEINNYAMPLLKSEAVTAQSANVDTISGASASSQAFVQSLQSALNQAKV